MPIVVLGVLFVVVAVNVFLYFGYSSETPTPPPAEPSTTIETPERTGPEDGNATRGDAAREDQARDHPPEHDPHRSSAPASATASAYLLSVAQSRILRAPRETSRPFVPSTRTPRLWTTYPSENAFPLFP